MLRLTVDGEGRISPGRCLPYRRPRAEADSGPLTGPPASGGDAGQPMARMGPHGSEGLCPSEPPRQDARASWTAIFWCRATRLQTPAQRTPCAESGFRRHSASLA